MSENDNTVWLDGRNWQPGGTGVHSYVHGLRDTLTECGIPSRIVLQEAYGGRHARFARAGRFVSAVSRRGQTLEDAQGNFLYATDLFRTAHSRFGLRRRLTELRLPPSLQRPRLMHWTAPLPITLANVPNVVTIHDLIPLTHPELTGIAPDRHERLLRVLLKTVDAVATVSETVRTQLIEQFSIEPQKLHNLYQPVSFDAALLEAVMQAEPLVPDGGFICIGRVESRKNIDRLLEAHAMSSSVRTLTLIGPDGDDRPDCRSRGATSHVVRIPWCDKIRLLRTLKGARALLFPSLAEGFGLPIIEAMSLGTPVLTSRGGATGEVAGDAAYLVDPLSVRDIADGIAALDSELEDGYLQQLSARGRARAARFSQEHFTRRLSSFYATVDPGFASMPDTRLRIS
ncbi:glycosyltransferase [Asaia krungthepensis]|uniref:glycosyltransferase n=1 Tax=Asaia krungthepensis TaxID=220990 RepID=UPI00222EEBD1|nr:glycosyltransferase [Asaia krungthepensis]